MPEEDIPFCFPCLMMQLLRALLNSGGGGLLRRCETEWPTFHGLGKRLNRLLIGTDRLHDGAGCRAHQLLLVSADSCGALVDRNEGAVKMRNHEAREHLIAA